jgi:pyruvate kinase
MADLPGPKMRLGKINPEPIQLRIGDIFTLTSEDIIGSRFECTASNLHPRLSSHESRARC